MAGGVLAACMGQGPEVFDKAAPVSGADGADWPRLADIPPTPPAGVYTKSAPDPAQGEAVRAELAAAAEASARRRRALEGPVE